MKKFLFLLSALALVTGGCSKPAPNTAPAAATPKPAASTAPKAAAKKPPATNPVPADWLRMYDDVKGYEFMVPQGTTHKSETVDGVDIYMAGVPAPYDLGVMVVSLLWGMTMREAVVQRSDRKSVV